MRRVLAHFRIDLVFISVLLIDKITTNKTVKILYLKGKSIEQNKAH